MDPQLTNEDVADILALLDSLPYDEFDLETARFRLTLRRTPGGWTKSTQVLSAPEPLEAGGDASAPDEQAGTDEADPGGKAGPPGRQTTTTMSHRGAPDHHDVTSSWSHAGAEAGGRAADEADVTGGADGGEDAESGLGGERNGQGDGDLVAVRAPLPGTFYRASRPGAAPFVEVGSRVGTDTVIGIVETMKLMNSVHAGVAGVVAEFCVANAELVAQEAALLRIRAGE
jgi:acetyl-CoA carboxylase biotin carboxyl carrier protein